MSKNLLAASIVALFFSSVCLANGAGSNSADTDLPIPAEMKAAVAFCDGHNDDVVIPTETN